ALGVEQAPAFPALQPLLAAAAKEEAARREQALDITFSRTPMGLPTCRAARLVSRAMRAVPLVADRDAALPVLWEDEYFIAVDKPEGMQTAPVHRYKGGSVVNALIGQLGGRPPHVLHRLDMDTSGVLLMAKQPGVVAAVHRQFRWAEGGWGKLYLALGVGQAPFFASQAAPHLHSVCLAAASPHSGRTHQIRLHLAAHGHPLLGDDLYGLQGPWIARQALHAARLEFKHPVTGQQVAVHAPLPKDICSAATAFGLQDELLTPAPEAASRLAWAQSDLQPGCNDLHSEQQLQHHRMMQVQLLDQAWYRVTQESKPCHDSQ
ncbi:pseudouridine synthase, partial [Haematococcus lacustris]